MYRKLLTVCFALCMSTSMAFAQINELQVLHFEEMHHGQIIDQPLDGVSVSTINTVSSHTIRVFDTRLRQSEHPGLAGADGIDGTWAGGNLRHKIVMGNTLAMMPPTQGMDNSKGAKVSFEFSHPISEFGLDTINISEDDRDSYIAFYNGDDRVAVVKLHDFVNPAKDLYDPTVEFGSRTANRHEAITASDVSTIEFTRVEVYIASKDGAIDNITYKKAKPLAAIFTDLALPVPPVDTPISSTSLMPSPTPPLQKSARLLVIPTVGGTPTATPEEEEQIPVVPSPSAALAGLILLGVISFRRSR